MSLLLDAVRFSVGYILEEDWMLVSFSKALRSAHTVSVSTGWKLELNK